MNKYIAATLICASVISHAAFATSPPAPIQQQKQIAGYYQYQAGDVQITALLDGTNFMSPTLFKNLPEKGEIFYFLREGDKYNLRERIVIN